MEKAQKGVFTGTTKGTKANKGMAKSMMLLAKRALMVAPIWMLMRSAIMLVTNTIRDAIQANMDFQVQMARIKTVVSASAKSLSDAVEFADYEVMKEDGIDEYEYYTEYCSKAAEDDIIEGLVKEIEDFFGVRFDIDDFVEVGKKIAIYAEQEHKYD